MWLSTGDASTLGAEEVSGRLRVEVRQGLSWQEATHRRQLSGYLSLITNFYIAAKQHTTSSFICDLNASTNIYFNSI